MKRDDFQVNHIHRYEALLFIGFAEWKTMIQSSYLRNDIARNKEQRDMCLEKGIFRKDDNVVYADFGKQNVVKE